MNRRDFLKLSACSAAAGMAGCATKPAVPAWTGTDKIKSVLLHLGYNMWCEWLPDEVMKTAVIKDRYVPDYTLRNKDELWNKVINRMAERKLNMVVIDVGEGLVYPSHPELAVRGSWEPERMRDEIARLKKMGMVAVPKLNFSSSHDQWLGKWRPYLSTPEYFKVCSDLIRDVADVFDESPLFHLGYDEETYFIQNVNRFEYKRLRSGNLWWRDFLWFVDEVEKYGMRPWIWSDYCWSHKEEFISRMPRTVLQSNWYYGNEFDIGKMPEKSRSHVETYATLEKSRFDQMPCGSTYSHRENFGRTVEHCRNLIKGDRLKGFFMAPWYYRTQEDKRGKIMESLDVMAEEMRKSREWS